MRKAIWIILAVIMTAAVIWAGVFFVNNTLSPDDDDTGTDIEEMADDDDDDYEDDEEIDMSALDKIIEEESDIDNDVEFDEESEGAQLRFRKAAEDDFMGTWVATSGQAEFMYGNVTINILPLNKWTANIAEEDFNGTWEYDDGYLVMTSELINLRLSFTSTGTLVMQEDRDGSGEYINTVLTRK